MKFSSEPPTTALFFVGNSIGVSQKGSPERCRFRFFPFSSVFSVFSLFSFRFLLFVSVFFRLFRFFPFFSRFLPFFFFSVSLSERGDTVPETRFAKPRFETSRLKFSSLKIENFDRYWTFRARLNFFDRWALLSNWVLGNWVYSIGCRSSSGVWWGCLCLAIMMRSARAQRRSRCEQQDGQGLGGPQNGDHRKRDGNRNKICAFQGGWAGGQGGKLSKTLFFMGNVMTIKFEIENFIVEKFCCHGAGS